MTCPYCESAATVKRPDHTELGYRRFRCRACKRSFNERTGTFYNRLQYPTDVVSLVVLWRVRYKLSLRDLTEMFLQRGIIFSHEAVRAWESKFGAPGVTGGKFTVSPAALIFTALASPGDQKGWQQSAPFRPVKSKPFSRGRADHLRKPL